MTHGTRDARVPAGVGSVRTLVETGQKVKPPFLALAEARRRRVQFAGKKNARFFCLGRAERTSVATRTRAETRRVARGTTARLVERAKKRQIHPERRASAPGMAPAAPPPPRRITAAHLATDPRGSSPGTTTRDAEKAQLEKHLTAPFTSRDLFGVCRGACTVCDARECPGGYLKATRDYGKDAWEEARRRGDLRHPCNKDDMTNCTRCGCAAGKHEVDEGADARERGNDAFARDDYQRALLAYSK